VTIALYSWAILRQARGNEEAFSLFSAVALLLRIVPILLLGAVAYARLISWALLRLVIVSLRLAGLLNLNLNNREILCVAAAAPAAVSSLGGLAYLLRKPLLRLRLIGSFASCLGAWRRSDQAKELAPQNRKPKIRTQETKEPTVLTV